jgi:hypothetical protein
MRTLLAVLLFVIAGTSSAVQGTFASEDNDGVPMSVVFTGAVCTDEKIIAIAIHESYRAHPVLGGIANSSDTKFKQSFLNWKGKQYKSCYYEFADHAFSFDELGDMLSPVPFEHIQETADLNKKMSI